MCDSEHTFFYPSPFSLYAIYGIYLNSISYLIISSTRAVIDHVKSHQMVVEESSRVQTWCYKSLTISEGLLPFGALGAAQRAQLLARLAAGDVGLHLEAVALPRVQPAQLYHTTRRGVLFLGEKSQQVGGLDVWMYFGGYDWPSVW